MSQLAAPNQSKKRGPYQTRGFRSDDFQEGVFKDILFRMMNGEAVTTICQDRSQPEYSVFINWVNSSPDRFQEYARARQIQADYYADETVAIADEETDNIRARNRMDARRWHASKIAPKKYGERIQNDLTANIQKTVKVDLSSMSSDVREKLRETLLEQMKSAPTIDGDYSVKDK